MADATTQRLAFLDWTRGLACVLMFQTHGYDAWLSESVRHTSFFGLSQLAGTLPAPLFLFASGLSLALVFGRDTHLEDAPYDDERQLWQASTSA